MVGIRAGVVRGMTRGVMGCDYSHTSSYYLLLTHRRCSPCLVIHTGEVLSPFSGIQDWISLSQALFAGALWLPSGCVVATPLFMGSRYHTALSCLLLNTYYSHTGSYYLLLTHRQLLTTYYLPLSHRHGCWESGEEARTKRGDRATTRAEIGGGPSAQKAFRE